MDAPFIDTDDQVVETTQLGTDLSIKKVNVELPTTYVADLINTPDLAQTLVACLVGLKIKFKRNVLKGSLSSVLDLNLRPINNT